MAKATGKVIELSSGEKVEMREPKVKDVRILNHIKNDEERELKLVANLTMMSDSEMDELSLFDYRKLQEGLSAFLS